MNCSTRPVRLLISRSVLATTVLGLVVSGLAAVAHAHPTAPAAGPAPELVVGTYNIRAGVSLPGFKDAITAFKNSGVEVAGLQEIGSNDRNKYLLADHTWGYYRPPALQQNPIIWDRELFDFVGATGFKIAEARDLHGEHSGDEAKGDSWATIVRLVQRASGEQLSFINVHLVRGAVKGGRPVADKPHLFDLYADQVEGTVKAINLEKTKSDQVFVLGDFNVGYEADVKWRHRKLPFKKFSGVGFTSMWEDSPLLKEPYGTHNDALIDQVWTNEGSTSEKVLLSIKQSDHSPALATYALDEPEPGYQPQEGTVGFGDVHLAPNGNQPGDTENNGPSKLPSMFVQLQGVLKYGYVEIEVDPSSTATAGYDGDFVLDTSSMFDNDFTKNEITVDIVGDEKSEGDETIVLRLVNPVNTEVIKDAAEITLTIHDND